MKKFATSLFFVLAAVSCTAGTIDIVTPEPENNQPEQPQTETPSSPEQYSTLQFGNYRNEPVEWVVLSADEESALLVSKKLLSSRPWDESGKNLTYDKSSIRQWLNGDFVSSAFSANEAKALLPTQLDNSDQHGYGTAAGENTIDKVFLLSVNEYETYLKGTAYSVAAPTAKAKEEGAYTNGQGNAAWWLRSPGMTADSPAYLSSAGELGSRAHAATENIIGIRPAIRISLTGTKGINVKSTWEDFNTHSDKNIPTYTGPTVVATGVIKFIGIDSHGTPSMELAEEAGGTTYVLGVFGSFDEMGTAKVGNTVTISGRFHIMSEQNMVVIKRCVIL